MLLLRYYIEVSMNFLYLESPLTSRGTALELDHPNLNPNPNPNSNWRYDVDHGGSIGLEELTWMVQEFLGLGSHPDHLKAIEEGAEKAERMKAIREERIRTMTKRRLEKEAEEKKEEAARQKERRREVCDLDNHDSDPT